MTNHNSGQEYIDELLASFSDDKLSEIDFDKLKEWLRELKVSLCRVSEIESDLNLLREDFLERIAGMVKAVTIVEKGSESTESVLAYLEDLKNVTAEELIGQYRKTSNRFRIAFPSTFGLAPVTNQNSASLKKIRDYK